MIERLRRRIEQLEAGVPRAVVLTLRNEHTFSHPGPDIQFFNEGMEQIRAGKGPILAAVKDSVKAEGCGRMAELLKALLPVEGETYDDTLARAKR